MAVAETCKAVNRTGGTVVLPSPVPIISGACIVGKKELEGPLSEYFLSESEGYETEESWESTESSMQKSALDRALRKAKITEDKLDFVFAGDLLGQNIASTFGMRHTGIPYFGVYGACSTMSETLALGSMAVSGGFAAYAACVTGSHFCSAERTFRMPLEYGSVRTPTSQWTVTAAGCAILGNGTGDGPLDSDSDRLRSVPCSHPCVTRFTTGRIVDAGAKDAANMGAAMAPAAFDTISTHLDDLSLAPDSYDLILTGDLGAVGAEILTRLFEEKNIDLKGRYNDCGLMIYDRAAQDVHAGGSGCGCSAAVLIAKILPGMREGRWNRILFCATGALLSPISSAQGESIPGICTAITIENISENIR